MEIKKAKLYKLFKQNNLIYSFFYKLTNTDYKKRKKKIKNGLKSYQEIQREMALLKEYWKCSPVHYIRYGLFDMNLSEEELLDYIPPFYFYTKYVPSIYKNINISIYDDKRRQYKLLKEKDIPVPEIIGICKNRRIYDWEEKELFFDNLVSKYLNHNNSKLFFKPVAGQGGSGIIVVKRDRDNLYVNNEIIKSCDNILEKFKAFEIYVIQKGILQRKDFNAINSSSVNTLRVITQLRCEKPVMCACVIRIGRSNKEVDNSHQGGLSVSLDVDNGRMGNYAVTEHSEEIFHVHPDSGYKFAGQTIQNWNNIKQQILSYTTKIDFLKEIAWDIAISETSVEVIEFNLGYGIDHLQCTCGGMRRKLNVYP